MIRDVPIVLSFLVWLLKFTRRVGFFKSERFYRHVPYHGLVRVEPVPGHYFNIVSRGGHIENSLYWEGIYLHEAVSMRTWSELASESSVVLDIGANSGVFALVAAAMGAKQVHAFEPLPRIYGILCENIKSNTFGSVKAWQCAVSDKAGEAELFDPGGVAPTSASLSSQFTKSHLCEGYQTIRVPVTSVDSFCSEHGICQVDLIKIDVEGYEEFVLHGMVQTVFRCKPVIVMEVLEEYDTQLRMVVDDLFEGVYRWERINEGGEQKSLNVLLTPITAARPITTT